MSEVKADDMDAVSGSPAPECSYWAMVDKGRTNYPYEEHWRDCDICQKRDPNRVGRRIARIKSKLAPPNSGVYVGKGYTLADLHEDLNA